MNGQPAATAVMSGNINGKAATIRVVAIRFDDKSFARFQVAMPKATSSSSLEKEMQKATFSFRRLTTSEKNRLRPSHVKLVAARSGDTPEKMAARMSNSIEKPVARFRVLNALMPDEPVIAGRLYKVVAD